MVRWQSDLVYTIQSVLRVCDKPYHMNNGFQQMWAEIIICGTMHYDCHFKKRDFTPITPQRFGNASSVCDFSYSVYFQCPYIIILVIDKSCHRYSPGFTWNFLKIVWRHLKNNWTAKHLMFELRNICACNKEHMIR